ncbi:hypothetical protein [Limnobaculum xujianqingii]|uniref:hypothetical protein n=1 Tax=Limnobaculum xujianqingii TaxID=2738837 RepID=UPI001E6449D0|nr:hypothetical protein [Limnobaculum xujianqingii]
MSNDINTIAQQLRAAAIINTSAFLTVTNSEAIALCDALEAAQKHNNELETSENQLITERDNAEQALSDMFMAVIGEPPEWSNVYGFIDAVDDVSERITYLESDPVQIVPDDYFASLVETARVSANKAIAKFPQPNYVLLKVAEEAGEVVQAGVHYAENRKSWQDVEGEIVQLLAMLIRLVTEGDQINGVTPPDHYRITQQPATHEADVILNQSKEEIKKVVHEVLIEQSKLGGMLSKW